MTYQNAGSHILHQFDEDLESTRTKVLRMGGLVEKQVENSLLALINADSNLESLMNRNNDYLREDDRILIPITITMKNNTRIRIY